MARVKKGVLFIVIKGPKRGEPQLVGAEGGLGASRQYYLASGLHKIIIGHQVNFTELYD